MLEFIKMNENDQINFLADENQRKIFIDEYNQNPNLILFCTRGANQKLIEFGFDVASYDEIFMNFEGGGKDVLQDYSFNECLKKYRRLGESGCFDYVKPDGNCAVWSSMQAFRRALGYKEINFDDPKEFDAMVKLREEVADLYCTHGTEDHKRYKTPGKWTNPELFMKYLSEKNNGLEYFIIDRTYCREEKKFLDDFSISLASFQNMINGCPFVYFSNDNHFVNLKPDLETRKKFIPLFYDFYKSYFIYLFLVWRNISGLECLKKSKLIWVFLKKLFKDANVLEINKIMDDFLKDLPHKYKPVLTFKLIFYIFEKYKMKILDKLDFKLKSNEFLSDVLVDFKKEVVDKDPKFSKKQEDKKNMQVDVDNIFKKFDIDIGKNISFKNENFDYLETISDDLYNNYTDDVPKDNNCVFWSAMQAFEKRIIDKKADYQKMLDLRKKTAEWCEKKYSWLDDNQDYKNLVTPGVRVKVDYVLEYLACKYNIDIFDFSCYGYGGYFNFYSSRQNGNFLNLKDTFFSIINGAYCTIGSKVHSRSYKLDFQHRKNFYLKFFDLYMIRELITHLYCKKVDSCAKFLRYLFYDEQESSEKLKIPIQGLIKSVPDELKPQKFCELGVFAYKKFKTEVLEKENKDISAYEFYLSVFNEFKEKYIDNDPDLKQSKESEENKEEQSTDSESESEPKIDHDPNHESQETTEHKIDPEPENIPKDPDFKPTPNVDQMTPKPEISEQNNDQQTNKPKENNKKDGFKTKDKSKSKSEPKTSKIKRFFFILACIFSFSLVYWFSKLYEKLNNNRDKLLPDDKNNPQNKDEKIETNETKESVLSKSKLNAKKPLSNLSNVNSQIENNTKKDLPDRESI